MLELLMVCTVGLAGISDWVETRKNVKAKKRLQLLNVIYIAHFTYGGERSPYCCKVPRAPSDPSDQLWLRLLTFRLHIYASVN